MLAQGTAQNRLHFVEAFELLDRLDFLVLVAELRRLALFDHGLGFEEEVVDVLEELLFRVAYHFGADGDSLGLELVEMLEGEAEFFGLDGVQFVLESEEERFEEVDVFFL